MNFLTPNSNSITFIDLHLQSEGNFRKWWQLHAWPSCRCWISTRIPAMCLRQRQLSRYKAYHISPTWISPEIRLRFPLLHFDFGVTSHFVTIPRNAAQINWCCSSLVWCYQWSCRTPLYNAMGNHSHRPRWIPWCCLPNSNGCWSRDVLHTSYDHPNSPWSAKPSDPCFAHGFWYCLGDKSWDQWSLMVIVCQSLTHFSWAVPPEHTTFIRNCVSFLDTGGAPIWNLRDPEIFHRRFAEGNLPSAPGTPGCPMVFCSTENCDGGIAPISMIFLSEEHWHVCSSEIRWKIQNWIRIWLYLTSIFSRKSGSSASFQGCFVVVVWMVRVS